MSYNHLEKQPLISNQLIDDQDINNDRVGAKVRSKMLIIFLMTYVLWYNNKVPP